MIVGTQILACGGHKLDRRKDVMRINIQTPDSKGFMSVWWNAQRRSSARRFGRDPYWLHARSARFPGKTVPLAYEKGGILYPGMPAPARKNEKTAKSWH